MLLEAAWTVIFIVFYPIVAAVTERFVGDCLVPVGAIYAGIFLFLQNRANRWKCPMFELFLRKKGSGFALSLQATMWSLSIEERRYGVLMPEAGVGG
jgi:hypothetical protein